MDMKHDFWARLAPAERQIGAFRSPEVLLLAAIMLTVWAAAMLHIFSHGFYL